MTIKVGDKVPEASFTTFSHDGPKPLTTDETKCQAILDAEKRNNRKIVVTFNYRYAPAHQQMKEILLSGDHGKIEEWRREQSRRRTVT